MGGEVCANSQPGSWQDAIRVAKGLLPAPPSPPPTYLVEFPAGKEKQQQQAVPHAVPLLSLLSCPWPQAGLH